MATNEIVSGVQRTKAPVKSEVVIPDSGENWVGLCNATASRQYISIELQGRLEGKWERGWREFSQEMEVRRARDVNVDIY